MNITTALLSFGMSGRVFHAPFIYAHPGFTLAGSWERSTKDIQNHYPQAKSYSSLESVLKDDSIQLVVVNTPTSTHFEYTKLALEAGKHVIVEKAFTTTAAEAEELEALAKSRNLKLSVYQNRRWDSDFSTVKQVVKSGKLGDIVTVTFSFDRFNPNLSPKLHKETKGPGAGLLYDLGSHLIDQALHLFGLPESVFATIAITREQSQVDDLFEIFLFYTQFRVRLSAGYFIRKANPSYILHGTKGSFIKSRADIQELELQKGEKPDSDNWGSEPVEESGKLYSGTEGKAIPTLSGDYMQYYHGIYESISKGKTEPVTASDGVRVMKVLEAAKKSNQEGRVVTVS